MLGAQRYTPPLLLLLQKYGILPSPSSANLRFEHRGLGSGGLWRSSCVRTQEADKSGNARTLTASHPLLGAWGSASQLQISVLWLCRFSPRWVVELGVTPFRVQGCGIRRQQHCSKYQVSRVQLG